MAKPTKYSQAVLDRICDELAQGRPLTQICRGMAEEGTELAPRTVRDWANEKTVDGEPTVRAATVSAAIARAREAGEYALAEECLEIADDARNDWMQRNGGEDEAPGYMLNGEHVQRSKLRIETRLKLLAKFNPKRWGDKVAHELTGADGGAIKTVTCIELVAASPGDGESTD